MIVHDEREIGASFCVAYHLFAAERERTGDLSFTIFVGYAFRDAFLVRERGVSECGTQAMERGLDGTFVNTAMDAYEFPRFMPTMGGAATSTGVSTFPFGTEPFCGMCGDDG